MWSTLCKCFVHMFWICGVKWIKTTLQLIYFVKKHNLTIIRCVLHIFLIYWDIFREHCDLEKQRENTGEWTVLAMEIKDRIQQEIIISSGILERMFEYGELLKLANSNSIAMWCWKALLLEMQLGLFGRYQGMNWEKREENVCPPGFD